MKKAWDRRGRGALRGSVVAAALTGGCGAEAPPGNGAGWRAISDDFDGPLSAWETLHPERAQFEVADGALYLRPLRHTAWHGNQRAFQLYQTVEGDFSVTATVRVMNLAGGEPAPIWRLAGLASSTNDYNGWFFGAGLWEMDPAIDWIADDGDIDTCVFISSALDGSDPRTTADDDEPLGGMRDFVEALTQICDHVVLYLTWGAYGASPTRNPNDYDTIIASYIEDARTLEAEYPHVITVPMGLVFHDLMSHPPVAVPRMDYLHRPNNDPHQNMLGAVIIAWTFYAVLADVSPVGAAYAYNDVMGPAFVVGDRIGLGTPTDPFGGGSGATIPFDASTQQLFQQRIEDLVIQWQTQTTAFD